MDDQVFYHSPIGVLEIRCHDDYISGVLFHDTTKKRNVEPVPDSSSITTNELLKKCIVQLDEYFCGHSIEFKLPLRQEGTIFQQSVWSELQKIPYGRTVSYLHLSKQLGNTKAIRAVGTANGRNNIAIIVPCHRVIGSNGSLVGYGGDLWRKQWLLQHEAKIGNGVQELF